MGAGASKKKDKEPKTPSRLAPTGGQNRSRASSLTPSTGTNAARPRSRSRSPGINPAKLETKDLMISYSHADKEFMNKLKGNIYAYIMYTNTYIVHVYKCRTVELISPIKSHE